jgi:hypothetical protein
MVTSMGVSRRSQVGATHCLRASAALRLDIMGLDIMGLDIMGLDIMGLDIMGLGITACSPTLLTT